MALLNDSRTLKKSSKQASKVTTKPKLDHSKFVVVTFKIGKIEFRSTLNGRHSVVIAYSLILLKILPWLLVFVSIATGRTTNVLMLIIEYFRT